MRSQLPALFSFVLLACTGSLAEGQRVQVRTDPVAQTHIATPARSTVPTDFSIAAGGGPVAAWMGAGMTFTHTRIAPSTASVGAYDVVVEESLTDEMGHETNLHETRRVQVASAQIEALHAFIVAHQRELEGPCMNPEIMDGGYAAFTVHRAGEDMRFQCTNARTPSFTQLEALYEETLRSALGG